MFNVIPAIDILGGKLVRLTQGDYAQVDSYAKSPLEMAQYFESMGAERIHIVDLDGARAGDLVNADVIREICASVTCEIQVGGGIRDRNRLETVLGWGVTFAIVGSVFAKDMEMAKIMIDGLESQVIAGVDVKDGFVAIHGWEAQSSLSTQAIADALAPINLAGVVFTDISRDGMMAGPNFEAVGDFTKLTAHGVIASGGVRGMADILKLKLMDGVSGCIVGKALLSGEFKADLLWS